jgi:hypothetical protein
MRTLSNAGLIDVWERGAAEHPVDRALTLLSICTGEPSDTLAGLSIGARDRKLMQVYEQLFGPVLNAFARCPACDEPHEYTLSTHDLVTPPASDERNAISLTTSDAIFALRLPNSLDLRAVVSCVDPELAGRILAERCVLEAHIAGKSIPSNELPHDAIEPISSALAAADPAAEVLIGLNCIACSHQWQVALDIERFLWSKITAASKRLLREVHALASAYGWSEADILALSPARRQIYMELAWAAS